MPLPACLFGVVAVALALTGALSNSPPSFSESYYVDSVSEEVENDGLLTTVTCSDSDGEDLILNVTSDLPFRTRVVASGVSPNQFDIVVADSAGIDLSLEYSGISFTLVCSDGVANDTAEVALNVVPTSAETPEFTNAPNPVRILSSVQMGTTIATYRASLTSGVSVTYDLDELVKDSVPFTMNPTLGELMVSEALLEERYDLIILSTGDLYTTRIHVVVLVNFQPMFEHKVFATLDAGAARIGDTVLNIPLCLDQNHESTANGNLTLLLEGTISRYFRITQEGSLKVVQLLRDLSGGLYQLTVRCSDRGQPQILSDELIISLQIVPAGPGEMVNHPPSFSQDVYIDAVDSGIMSSGVLLTTLHCMDEDDPTGDLLTVSIQPGSLPFAVRIVRSNSEASGYDVVTDEMVELEQYLETGLQFYSSCSDGSETDVTFVALDIVPASESSSPEFIPLTAINILENIPMNTDIGTFSIEPGVSQTVPTHYSVTEVLGNNMTVFRIHPTLGNLSVSGVLVDERYLVVVAAFNGEASATTLTTVHINFRPVFTSSSFEATVNVSGVAVGDSIGAVSCTDKNSKDTLNGNLTLQLQLHNANSSYFSIMPNGTVVVNGDLHRLLALGVSTVNGYINCTDQGQPDSLSSTLMVSIALEGPATPGTVFIIPIAVGAILAVSCLWLLVLVPTMGLCLIRRCCKKKEEKDRII